MIQYGACNAQAFAVHKGATPTGLVGTALTSPKALDVWSRKNSVTDINVFRATVAGQQWGWEYETDSVYPIVRIIRNSSDGVVYAFEAESKTDHFRTDYIPLIATDDYDRSIIPSGGSAVWMVMPSETDLETIEALVVADSIPAWASGTAWSAYTTTQLLKQLFRQEQSRLGLYLHSTIGEVFTRSHSVEEYKAYMLLWMRSASRILYDHYGQTCIPLILDKFSVDSDGYVSL